MNKVVHFEIPVGDMQAAKKFYQDIFGWKIDEYPGMNYYGAITVETDNHVPKEPGAINGGIMPKTSTISVPVIAISVPSVDEYIEKITKAGGKVVKEKQVIADMGYYAYVSDPDGNILGLWQDIEKK